MSYSISTLLTRNPHDVFVENDPKRRRAAIDEIFTEDWVFYEPAGAFTVAATRSVASRARSGLLTIAHFLGFCNWLISKVRRSAISRRGLSFSTSYRENLRRSPKRTPQ